MPSRIERKKTAYHEAGHAVIAWYYNNPPLNVSIVNKGDILAGVVSGVNLVECQTWRSINLKENWTSPWLELLQWKN